MIKKIKMEHIYEINIEWVGQSKGLLRAPDLSHTIEVATPPQFPNGMEDVWSPEHLFVASVNSCLMTTFLAIAANSRLEFVKFSSKASGKLEQVDGRYRMSEIWLEPLVTVASEKDSARALRVIEKAEANCLISNSIQSKIVLKPIVEIQKTAV